LTRHCSSPSRHRENEGKTQVYYSSSSQEKGKEAKGVKAEKQVKMPKKEMTKIEKLESELNAIEDKLKNLS